MQMVRTTLRLKKSLKEAAEILAVKQGRTLQEVFNEALEHQLKQVFQNQAKQIVFGNHSLGVPLDNLTREDYYSKE